MQKDGTEEKANKEKQEPNVLPATEVRNPEPRANGNLGDGNTQPASQKEASGSSINSEITDGEDA